MYNTFLVLVHDKMSFFQFNKETSVFENYNLQFIVEYNFQTHKSLIFLSIFNLNNGMLIEAIICVLFRI
jgi:hypothetical protein